MSLNEKKVEIMYKALDEDDRPKLSHSTTHMVKSQTDLKDNQREVNVALPC